MRRLGRYPLRRLPKAPSAARHFHQDWASAPHPAVGRVPALPPAEYPAGAARALAVRDRVPRERSALRPSDIAHLAAECRQPRVFISRDNAFAPSPVGRRNTQFAYRSNAAQVPSVRLRRPAGRTGKRRDGLVRSFSGGFLRRLRRNRAHCGKYRDFRNSRGNGPHDHVRGLSNG